MFASRRLGKVRHLEPRLSNFSLCTSLDIANLCLGAYEGTTTQLRSDTTRTSSHCNVISHADSLRQMQGQLPPGITLVSADNFETWYVDIQVIDPNPIYAGETYRLRFTFSQNYPIEVGNLPTQSTLPTAHPPKLAPYCSNL